MRKCWARHLRGAGEGADRPEEAELRHAPLAQPDRLRGVRRRIVRRKAGGLFSPGPQYKHAAMGDLRGQPKAEDKAMPVDGCCLLGDTI